MIKKHLPLMSGLQKVEGKEILLEERVDVDVFHLLNARHSNLSLKQAQFFINNFNDFYRKKPVVLVTQKEEYFYPMLNQSAILKVIALGDEINKIQRDISKADLVIGYDFLPYIKPNVLLMMTGGVLPSEWSFEAREVRSSVDIFLSMPLENLFKYWFERNKI